METKFEEKKETYIHETGQTLVIVVLLIFALVAMLALVLDGGMAYAQRRAAQNAADAGALAGANVYCSTGEVGAAIAKALEYSVDYNHSNPMVTDPDDNYQATTAVFEDGVITVSAPITYPAFFARIFNYSDMTVSASASAGCFAACGASGVLPIIFSCSPPAEEPYEWDEHCQLETGEYITNPAPIYVIADSSEIRCDQGEWNCDDIYDADGRPIGVWNSSSRSWLDLDGHPSSPQEIEQWLLNPETVPDVTRNTWYASGEGVQAGVYDTLDEWEDESRIFVVPVFNSICKQTGSPSIYCDKFRSGDLEVDGGNTTANRDWFRVYDFAIFVLTCVGGPGQLGDCPGRTAFIQANVPNQWNNVNAASNLKTIEGYFIEGVPEGAYGRCGDSPNAGVYTIYLSR
jgi:hypothetical protein